MSKFTKIGSLAAAVLLAFLVFRGEGAPTVQARSDSGRGNSGQVEDVSWLLLDERLSGVPLRDIFSPADSRRKPDKEESKPAGVTRDNPVVSKPGPKTKAWQPPQLVGIAIRRGVARAFFVDEEDNILIASAGDSVKGYRIARIQERQVDVHDLRNGLKRTIYLK